MQNQQDQKTSSYQAVIQQVIKAAIQQGRGGVAGFYMLNGPTGSGKSSALYRSSTNDGSAAVLEYLKQQEEGKFPAILVTHRWNILQDIYKQTVTSKDSQQQPYRVSMLYGQTEAISSAVGRQALPHESLTDPKDFPCFEEAIKQLDTWQLFAKAEDKAQLARNCRAVRDLSHGIEKHGRFTSASLLQNQRDELSKLCGMIESALLKIMTQLEEDVAHLHGVDTGAAVLAQAQKKLADYRAQPWIRRVFPAIAWRDEKHDLLVMTTHKLLYSFYDGIRKVRLSSPNLSGYVIFIDEFDYQADVFQSLLAQAQKIQELPICIALLLEKGNELIQRIQHDPRPDVQNICKLLSDLLIDLKSDLAEKNIDLSSVNNFVMPLEDFKAGRTFQTQYLFRADHLATREPLVLCKTEQGFAVVQGKASNKGDIDVGQFLRLMEGYLRRYTTLFSNPAWSDSNAYEYLRQLNALLFDSTNDYQTSYYSRVLPKMAHFTLPMAHVPELNPLLNSNVLPHTQANLHGFTTWLLKGSEDAYAMDRQRLQVKRAFMPTTAEGLLVALASRNLVFGLSATAYIERALGHFDVRWVKSALHYIAQARDLQFDYSHLGDSLQERKDEWLKKPIPYLASATDLQQQLQMIKSLTRIKADLRATDLLVREESFATRPTFYYEELINSLPSDFFSNEGGYESSFALEHRQKLLVGLLQVLKVAAEREKHQGHLVFVNSSRHLRQLLSQHRSLLAQLTPWLLDEPSFYTNLSRTHALYGFDQVFVSLELLQRPVFVCFLIAENQKKPGFMEAYQAAFASGRTVIVVAQAASATNGINLDFTVPTSGLSSDLTCLYLLESHHFYFSSAQGQSDAMTHAGMQLRDLDKLRRFSQISRAEHRRFLSPLMAQEANGVSTLNKLYKKTEDMCKNVAADVQQQVGRIERAWESVPEIEIYIEPNIAGILRNFYSLPTYQNNKGLVSELNQRLLSELNTTTGDDEEWLKLLSTPAQSANKAVDWIEGKLVPAVQRARTDKKLFTQIEPIWRELGRAVLQYDLMWQPRSKTEYLPAEPLKDWACVVRPDAELPSKKLWFNPSTWQFFPSEEQGCRVFDLEQLYQPVQHCPAILEWFGRKDYRTSLFPFANEVEERFILHPLVVQRILQGRLGEESIRALLEGEGIQTTAEYADHAVFESYDFAIVNNPFRVDAKYWSSYSLDRADALFVAQEGKDSPFTKFSNALKTMHATEGQHTRLLIINLLTAGSSHSLVGLTAEGKHVAAENADIVLLEGCLNSQTFAVTSGFKKLIRLINEVGNHE